MNLSNIGDIFIAFVFSAIIGMFVIPKIVRVAIKKDLVAKPNHRTSHTGRIPNIGGVSIFISFILSFIVALNIFISKSANISNGDMIVGYTQLQYMLFTIITLFFVGLYDDIMVISAKRKLLGELFGISIMIFLGDFRFTNLHGFFGIYDLPYFFSVFLTFFVVVVIINALNLIDGIDGLASGIGMLISLFFGVYFLLIDKMHFSIAAFALVGALLPFFMYNVFAKRNKIFMGDAGALVLGFILSALVIYFNEVNILPNSPYHIVNAPMVSLCILAIPMFDTIRVFTIRLAQKRSPFSPDKNHLHHMFLALGYNHKQATGTLLIINTIYIIAGLLLQNTPKFFFFTVIFLSCVVWSELLRFVIKTREKEKCDKVFS